MSDDRLGRIEATLTRLVNDVGEVKGSIRALRCDVHSSQLTAMDETLHGNGHPGIKSGLADVKRTLTDHLAGHDRSRVSWWNVLSNAIALVAVLIAVLKG